ncbi:DUF2442 domain-containing protein [Christiangramia forsetii]|uniref:DUF2442 domain-containing protein n=2 Tax=Christiangramia forsetii TaxID=411153 RepID=A0M7H3_CHRFK|nr:DUF2442 domain-containing protein [Christiangramia forsetii]GGG27892.1 hypothetical protein GCM10011532_09070 [Christiangramia forsetii]CAL68568.1 conserved hypothetical protein [Christiangramia forsetii KT0803]
MNTVVDSNIKINKVFFRDEKVFFDLEDGREIGAPLKWYPKLLNASEKERLNFSISPSGYGVHWKELDEDLSAYGMLHYNQELNTQSR